MLFAFSIIIWINIWSTRFNVELRQLNVRWASLLNNEDSESTSHILHFRRNRRRIWVKVP